MKTVEQNRQMALDFFSALNAADRGRLRELLDPGITWSVPKSAAAPYAGEHQGVDKVMEMMLSAVENTFDAGGVEHQILLSVAEGDHVVVETRMQADQADGRHYDNFYVFIFRFSGGRIAAIREHVDTAYAVAFFS